MKENKKKLLIILVILVVGIFVILTAVDYINSYDKNERAQKEYGYETMPAYRDTEINYQTEKEIKYINISALQRLKGELPTTNVMKKVKKVFIEEIPEIIEEVKQYNNTELKKYYSTNSSNIKQNLNIETEESFINMVNQFKNVSCNLTTEFKSCEFMKEKDLSLKFLYENDDFVECKILGEHVNLIVFEF